MVCTADDLRGWKDFPKGLKVLVLDGDEGSAAEMRSKLENMNYIVSIFTDEAEALSAVLNASECFHVALVEVRAENCDGVFKFLETAKDLPTILVSTICCLSTMMKCIALGAVEFLQKPLSDDKLRNIWQHVVHKAFNAGDKDALSSSKPIKDSVISMLQFQLGGIEEDNQASATTETLTLELENKDIPSGSDKYPAPSTPQLKDGDRSFDNTVRHFQANFAGGHESRELDGESKSVETTSITSVSETTALSRPVLVQDDIKEEHEPSVGCGEIKISSHLEIKDPFNCRGSSDTDPKRDPAKQDSCGMRSNKRKTKVDWSPELHKKFVQAVEKLGVYQAIPSRILELMKVEGLTRHNVASHLQKYRLHRRHILPKEEDRRWPHHVNSAPQNPVMAYPPYYPHHNLPPGQLHPPSWSPYYSSGSLMWGSPYYPQWQLPTESWHWKPFSGLHADVWGCPVIPSPPNGSYPQVPQITQQASDCFGAMQNPNRGNTVNVGDLHPAEDEIDKVVKEAISKPWLPLPLGLKPPSTDSVLNELTKQGISTVPPRNKGRHTC